jgi:hypothetical protein
MSEHRAMPGSSDMALSDRKSWNRSLKRCPFVSSFTEDFTRIGNEYQACHGKKRRSIFRQQRADAVEVVYPVPNITESRRRANI